MSEEYFFGLTTPDHEHEWVVLHHYGDDGEHYCPTGFVRCIANEQDAKGTVLWFCGKWDRHKSHPEIDECTRWAE